MAVQSAEDDEVLSNSDDDEELDLFGDLSPEEQAAADEKKRVGGLFRSCTCTIDHRGSLGHGHAASDETQTCQLPQQPGYPRAVDPLMKKLSIASSTMSGILQRWALQIQLYAADSMPALLQER